MYDTLLFLHVLGAFVTSVTVVFFCAWGFGAPVQRGAWNIADQAWNVSGALLIIFGVWLALYIDGYELWDGWIIGALVLFGLASFFGARAREGVIAVLGEGEGGHITGGQAAVWNWLRTISIVLILVLMVWKPGA